MSKAASSHVLLVPGYHGSGAAHWQTWLQARLPASRRLDQIDWEQPVLATWAGRLRDELSDAPAPLWVIAHSFGCLATAVAVADRPEKVAGLILVAPASPERFDYLGLRNDTGKNHLHSLQQALPWRALGVNGLLVASRNDPWLDFEQAHVMAKTWDLELVDAGNAGHINTDSGHGEWPLVEELFNKLTRKAPEPKPAVSSVSLRRGRGGALALVRQFTRQQMDGRN